jgi:hypothetical protein
MVWADIKAFIASNFCRNLNETKDAIMNIKILEHLKNARVLLAT